VSWANNYAEVPPSISDVLLVRTFIRTLSGLSANR